MKEFTVECTPDEYDEVAKILEGWEYEIILKLCDGGQNCITTTNEGYALTNWLSHVPEDEPRYTVEQLRTMENPNN